MTLYPRSRSNALSSSTEEQDFPPDNRPCFPDDAESEVKVVRASFSELAGVDPKLTVNQRWHQLNRVRARVAALRRWTFCAPLTPVTRAHTHTHTNTRSVMAGTS